MAKLRNLRDVPPTGYKYTERATGHRFESDTYEGLVDKVRRHRAYKGLPEGSVEDDVQEQLCLCLDERYCRPAPGEDYRPVKDLTHKLTTSMAASANSALIEWAKDGFHGVEQAEADRRAAICRTCPFNKAASGCSCHSVYRLIESLIPATRKHSGISVCMACGCSLQAKVNLPEAVVAASVPEDVVFPPWCWQETLRRNAFSDTKD